MTSYLFFSLLLVGSLYATFTIFVREFSSNLGWGDNENTSVTHPSKISEYLYLAIIFVFILMAVTKPLDTSHTAYTVIVLIFGVFIYATIGFSFNYFLESGIRQATGLILVIVLTLSYLIPYGLNC